MLAQPWYHYHYNKTIHSHNCPPFILVWNSIMSRQWTKWFFLISSEIQLRGTRGNLRGTSPSPRPAHRVLDRLTFLHETFLEYKINTNRDSFLLILATNQSPALQEEKSRSIIQQISRQLQTKLEQSKTVWLKTNILSREEWFVTCEQEKHPQFEQNQADDLWAEAEISQRLNCLATKHKLRVRARGPGGGCGIIAVFRY